MSKNLTGNKRLLHDCCVDLYNSIQKWKSITSNVHSTILEICLIKQKELDDADLYDEEQLNGKDVEKNLQQLMSLSSELVNKFEGLEVIMEKMSRLAKKLKSINALSELDQSRNSSSDVDCEPVYFHTWPLSRFCETVEEIEEMYRKEFRVKSRIIKEICILNNKSSLIFFETSWKYEANIDSDRVNELLGGIIVELELFSQLS